MSDDFEYPWIGGTGSLHDLRDAESRPQPRLWNMRSVSRAGATALAKTVPQRPERRMGFIVPKTRR